MDFVTHLPRTLRKHDAVWVIVDRLTKSAHFLDVRITFTLEEFCKLYIREIVRLCRPSILPLNTCIYPMGVILTHYSHITPFRPF